MKRCVKFVQTVERLPNLMLTMEELHVHDASGKVKTKGENERRKRISIPQLNHSKQTNAAKALSKI